jgi:ribosomal silencing factor RsfS
LADVGARHGEKKASDIVLNLKTQNAVAADFVIWFGFSDTQMRPSRAW